jgi:hypothetical protein
LATSSSRQQRVLRASAGAVEEVSWDAPDLDAETTAGGWARLFVGAPLNMGV